MGATGIWMRKLDVSTGSDPMVLVVVEGTDRRNIVLDHFPFTVGRRTDRDLVLTDPRVSREHAVFMRENDGIYLEDQNSRQGTFVNGERITRQQAGAQRSSRIRGTGCVIRAFQSRPREFKRGATVRQPVFLVETKQRSGFRLRDAECVPGGGAQAEQHRRAG